MKKTLNNFTIRTALLVGCVSFVVGFQAVESFTLEATYGDGQKARAAAAHVDSDRAVAAETRHIFYDAVNGILKSEGFHAFGRAGMRALL